MIIPFCGKSQLLTSDELAKEPIYTSLESALKEPEKVYRLHLKGSPKMDSLPDNIYRLINLQELSVRRCRLLVLNRDIQKLSHLQHLNLEFNRLVRLPESLCELPFLRTLVINRNMIMELPAEIGRLSNLQEIEAWGNPLYVLPESIANLKDSLKLIDLRQIGFRKEEIEKIESQLPKTTILYTNLCDCHSNRK